MSALDNIEARKRVNIMAIDAGVPLVCNYVKTLWSHSNLDWSSSYLPQYGYLKVESGTAGYLGQVSSVIGGLTMCYDCEAKIEPKEYPVCTIHRTPSNIIHCIVWGKVVFNLVGIFFP